MKKFLLRNTIFCIVLFASAVTNAQTTAKNYALLIAGLGGSEEYTEKYQKFLLDSWKALTESFKFNNDNIIVLAEPKASDAEFINGVSNKENITKYFEEFAGKVKPTDNFFVMLFGHGSFDGTRAFLNIPRKDLSDEEYAGLLNKIKANRIVFVNTASASAPFIEKLSAPDRIVITATKSGTQRNQPLFAEYFVESLSSVASDMDKNGNISILEVFTYASQKTSRWYEDNNHLATEHPQIEDTGDKKSFRVNELEVSGEGSLAGVTYFKRRTGFETASGEAPTDSTIIKLIVEQEKLELAIVELKGKKANMVEDDYYTELEKLLIQLAKIGEELEKKKNNN